MKDCPKCKKKGRKKCWCGQEPKDLKMKKTKKSLGKKNPKQTKGSAGPGSYSGGSGGKLMNRGSMPF